MIESALLPFLQDATFKIVTKTIVDKQYKTTSSSYTEIVSSAVVVPHGSSSSQTLSLQEKNIDTGIDRIGKVDIFVENLLLKKDDMVVFNGINYTITDQAIWNTTLNGKKILLK